MKNKCYANVNVYFEIVHVRVHVRVMGKTSLKASLTGYRISSNKGPYANKRQVSTEGQGVPP